MPAPVPPAKSFIKPQGLVRLVTDPTLPATYRLNQETDVRTAIARGIKEYVEQLSYNAAGGRLMKFTDVFDTWSQAEQAANYPSAAVVASGDWNYDASSFTPIAYETAEGVGLVKVAEFEINATLYIYATDNRQRSQLMAMIERAMSPVDWMYGFRLELPHYFGSRATYEPLATSYEDSAEDSIRRFRRATVLLKCSTPVLSPSSLPFFQPGQPSFQADVQVRQEAFLPSGGGISPIFAGSGIVPQISSSIIVTTLGDPVTTTAGDALVLA